MSNSNYENEEFSSFITDVTIYPGTVGLKSYRNGTYKFVFKSFNKSKLKDFTLDNVTLWEIVDWFNDFYESHKNTIIEFYVSNDTNREIKNCLETLKSSLNEDNELIITYVK